MRRFSVVWIAPALALVALLAWVLSSPVGSSPDDDFHLASIWCATDTADDYCETAPDGRSYEVPEALVNASCFAFDSDRSAGCQRNVDFDPASTVETERGNFFGAYPPIYYGTMHLLVGSDIMVSVLAMRILTVVLFVGLTSAIFALLPPRRRPALVWAWAITTVPLGLFILTSNNPSSWATIGVGTAWIALLGYFESSGWRKAGLGAAYAVGTVMAAGARGDAALYIILATVAVLFLTFRVARRYFISALLPVAAITFCVGLFRFSRPVETATEGLTGTGGSGAGDLLSLIVYNVLETPFLWSGVFGNRWGLGWLDTSMPAVVWLGSFACFVAACFVGLGHLSVRKLLVALGGLFVLWAMPLAILVAAGERVGANVQPRYLLPIVVLFAGILLLAPGARAIRFSKLQTTLIAGTLSGTHAIALFLNTQRYVSGFDDLSWNLDANMEWWWASAPSPMFVWILGSTAYAALLFILLPRLSGREVVEPAPGPIPVGSRAL